MATFIEELTAATADLTPEQQSAVLRAVEYIKRRKRSVETPAELEGLTDSAEHHAIARAGMRAATTVWPREDFSDWPGFNTPRKQDGQ